MKKLSLTITVLFSGLCFSQGHYIMSQYYYGDFPGENVNILLNKTVTPLETRRNSDGELQGYFNFYKRFDSKTKKIDSYENDIRYSNPYELFGKKFKVVKIYNDITINPFSHNYFVLELENPELGTVFYGYNKERFAFYELEVVGGLKKPVTPDVDEGLKESVASDVDESLKKTVTLEVDENLKELKKFNCEDIETSFWDDGLEYKHSNEEDGIMFFKKSDDNFSKLYLKIIMEGLTRLDGKKEVTLNLSNNNFIEKNNAEIQSLRDKKKHRYIYTIILELKEKDVDLIINNPIKGTTVDMFWRENNKGKRLNEYLKCLSQ
ncbi:hypothetical protein RBH94_15095 [Aestuariibaculum sp. YM273]|uniref:hypothetical protein n=1 Tax=Aestuariibaculum sp. YM273 TaxID=3070659 RepID=UPI0027DB6B1B|nr:hypothetical protein [Aestuariibaculum sp. YM273]WMI65377.1 hypothetical protein RBH94_15095 [Aestuariibaculum sp. YM273]